MQAVAANTWHAIMSYHSYCGDCVHVQTCVFFILNIQVAFAVVPVYVMIIFYICRKIKRHYIHLFP